MYECRGRDNYRIALCPLMLDLLKGVSANVSEEDTFSKGEVNHLKSTAHSKARDC